MDRIAMAVLIGLFALTVACSKPTEVFQDPDGTFTVAFPKGTTPEASPQPLTFEFDSDVRFPLTEYQAHTPNANLFVRITDMRGREDLVGATIDGLIDTSRTGSTRFSVSDLRLDGRVGREVNFVVNGGMDTTHRVYYSRGKLYSTVINVKPSANSREIADAKSFLDSFHFADAEAAGDDLVAMRDSEGFYSASVPIWAVTVPDKDWTAMEVADGSPPIWSKGFASFTPEGDVRLTLKVLKTRSASAAKDTVFQDEPDQWKSSEAGSRSESTIELDGNAGREFGLVNADGSQSLLRFVPVGRRVYFLGAEWSPQAEPGKVADARHFLDSLAVTSPVPDDWVAFQDPDGRFIAAFPAEPYTEEHEAIRQTAHSFVTEYPDGAEMSIIVNDNANNLTPADIPSAIKWVAQQDARRVISGTEAANDGRTGQEIVYIDKNDGLIYSHRVFIDGGKIYTIGFRRSENAGEEEIAVLRRFQDSFHFVR